MSLPQLISLLALAALLLSLIFLFLPGTRPRTPPDVPGFSTYGCHPLTGCHL